MKKLIVLAAVIFTASLTSGCIVRTYTVTKDRVDQEVSGNQGYLAGTAPADAQEPKKFDQRTTGVVELELKNPFAPAKKKTEEATEKTETTTTAAGPKISEKKTTAEETTAEQTEAFEAKEEKNENLNPQQTPAETSKAALKEKDVQKIDLYVVQPGDTLQKIAALPQVYGTLKKWTKIYQANRDQLDTPDRIQPGQKLKIPRD